MVPEHLLYTKDHVWVKLDGDKATIGITDFAQNELGDINFVELPAPGKKVKSDGVAASIEAVKSATEVYTPLTGEVNAVNKTLEKTPGLINTDPYEAGWICQLKVSEPGETTKLLKPADYQAFLADLNT